MHRGATAFSESNSKVDLPANASSSVLDPSSSFLQEPTEHELLCKLSIAGWEDLREAFQEVVTEKDKCVLFVVNWLVCAMLWYTGVFLLTMFH